MRTPLSLVRRLRARLRGFWGTVGSIVARLRKTHAGLARLAYTGTTFAETTPASVSVHQSTNGTYYWRYRAANGEIQAGGKGYNRRADAWRGFDDFRLSLTLGKFKTVGRVRRADR